MLRLTGKALVPRPLRPWQIQGPLKHPGSQAQSFGAQIPTHCSSASNSLVTLEE